MKYKPFVEVKTFNDFKALKLSVDNTDSIYVTYDNNVQKFGTPDILYGQVVFIKDSGIIYLKGHFFTDKEFILSSEYEISQLERENLLLQAGDTFEEAFGKIEKTIIDNELTLAYTITDLNDKISYAGNGGNNSILSSKYTISELERENLLLKSGDTFEEAFGKIEKTIIDNELTLAYTITDLNEKISYEGKGLVLSNEYEISSLYSNDLLLQSGDTFEEAFGKIEKTIIDNELTTSRALNNLNKKFSISDEYQLSELERENLLLKSGDTFEEAFGKIEKTIIDNELTLAYTITDLNDKISYAGKGLLLSNEYAISELERENLLLKSGDTFEQAFGKIEKTIIDNELTLAYTITDLNDKISYAGKGLVLSNEYEISQLERENLLLKSGDTIEEALGKIEKTIIDNELTLAYTINDLSSKINNNYTETKSDWDETDASSSAYIQNKPDLSHFITQETKSDWNENNTSSAAYIQNKPDLSHFITQETKSDWNENNTSSAAYIQNKPDLSHFITQETKSDWNENNTSSAAYIQNKPNCVTSSISGLKIEIVNELPSLPDTNTIYIIQ